MDWDQVDWGQAEDDVRRLRQRIFKEASRDGDLKKVRGMGRSSCCEAAATRWSACGG